MGGKRVSEGEGEGEAGGSWGSGSEENGELIHEAD